MYTAASKTETVSIPEVSLEKLITHLKRKLNIPIVRYIGDLQQSCSRIQLIPGAAGGKRHIESIEANQADRLVVREISEWETAEYVRHARTLGKKLSLVELGHVGSEGPGSAYIATWVKKNFPSIPATHIPTGNALRFK